MLGATARTAMALVDSLLKLLAAQNADALIIPPADPPQLERSGEPRALSMPALGRDMVEAMAQELLDEPGLAALAAGRGVTAHYEAEGTRYGVRIEPRADGPHVTLRLPSEDPVADPATAAPPTAMPSAPPSPHPPPPPPPPSTSTPPAANDAPDRTAPPVVHDDALQPLGTDAAVDAGPYAPIFARAVAEDASDILMSSGCNPRLRVAGEITELGGPAVEEAGLLAFIQPALVGRPRTDLDRLGHADLALRVRAHGQVARYRANLFRQHTGLCLALRPVRAEPPTLELLNLPEELAPLSALPSGLVLMTGTAGSGKSTTLVALIEHINRNAAKHVITLEDPIEYEYRHRKALIHQRQVGTHVRDFSEGLRAGLRESPDVILVGEMRDRPTMAAALTAAETGHLVLSTLHAADAAMALDRIIDSFAEHQQAQVRFQLAGALRAIVTQRLIATGRHPQRVPAIELLRVNTPVATKIREGRGHQILSEIHKGRADGMLSFEFTIARLVRRGLLTRQAAMAHAADPALMAQYLGA